jgi:hypothetical protein
MCEKMMGEVMEKAKAKGGGSVLMDMANLWTSSLRSSDRVQIMTKFLDDGSECSK